MQHGSHPTPTELINSADPNAKNEPHVATWKSGKYGARKDEREEWAFDFAEESWHVCADFSMR